jgi:hypothetical protein
MTNVTRIKELQLKLYHTQICFSHHQYQISGFIIFTFFLSSIMRQKKGTAATIIYFCNWKSSEKLKLSLSLLCVCNYLVCQSTTNASLNEGMNHKQPSFDGHEMIVAVTDNLCTLSITLSVLILFVGMYYFMMGMWDT